jgi:Zinc dependent phospholipase C
MPAHFTHLLFAEEALRAALGEKAQPILDAHGNIFRFGAQGPDFFYHNQRTMPTGLRYGVALHRRGFGSLVEQMTRETLRLGSGPGSDLSAYILGFTTHGPLDSATHPYIGYFSGWVDPRDERTKKYFHSHPFLERILDVLILRERFGRSLDDFDFLSKVRCGKTLPYPVVKALVKGLNAIYPSYNYKSRDRLRVENAYHDSIFFYKLTNHLNPDLMRLTFRKDRKDGFIQRRLALVHPREIPADFDFLNLRHATWCHPCDSKSVSTASFIDLYEEALAACVEMLKRLYDVLAGRAPPDGLAGLVGDQSLDTGRENCPPEHADPFPLAEILDSMYAKLAGEAAGSP